MARPGSPPKGRAAGFHPLDQAREATMDGATLADAMGHTLSRAAYDQLAGPFTDALRLAQCTNADRVAMFCAQVGHESSGLFYREEIASGAAYEGRSDLGNNQPGDGRRFKGRGPIQLTGRANYGSFSRWAHSQGLVDSDTHFVDNPKLVAEPQWGFLAAAWYWTVARTRLNSYADAGDIQAATRAVNGGLNGLAERTRRWTICRAIGDRLTTGAIATPIPQEDDMTESDRAMLTAVYQQLSGSSKVGEWAGWATWAGGTDEQLTIVDLLRRNNVEVRQMWLAIKELRTEVAALKEGGAT